MVTNEPTKKIRRIVNSPFQMEHQGITVKVSKDGKVTLSNETEDSEEFDSITVSASVIIKTYFMLQNTKSVKWMDPSMVPKEEGKE